VQDVTPTPIPKYDPGTSPTGPGGGDSRTPPLLPTVPADENDPNDTSKGVRVEDHSCVVRASGQLACWGNNQLGQIGDGTFSNRRQAVNVPGMTGVSEAAPGGAHTCALRNYGQVWCWGWTEGWGDFDGSSRFPNYLAKPTQMPFAFSAHSI